MKKGRILFFIGGSYVSGLEIVTLHLLKGLKDNGYELSCVINGWNDGVFKEKLNEIGIPFHEAKLGWLYFRKPMWTLDSLANYPKAFLTCRKILRSFKPDVIHFCSYHNLIMLYPLIRIKSVYNLQETHLPTRKHKAIYNLLNKKINAFTAVSEHIKRVLLNLSIPNEKIHLIYNGIPAVTENGDQEREALVQSKILEFAIIGQVAEWKGHSNLVGAVQNLVGNKKDNFVVVVYGNDNNSYAASLKERIREKNLEKWFLWKGFVNSQDKIYEDCAVVIVPSLSEEPCSLTIIESMTRAKGLIVSDRGGNPELIQDKKNGLVFKADDDVSLSDCMQLLLDDRTKILEYGKEARNKALLEYSSIKMTSEYLSIYDEFINNHN
ncbi:MAG: hypothetical protein C5B59_15085 [Bacteroidetes bacterium]|nr:MAG: hypothetical protein C5B59_15085 [Bacteroidota bacterium]